MDWRRGRERERAAIRQGVTLLLFSRIRGSFLPGLLLLLTADCLLLTGAAADEEAPTEPAQAGVPESPRTEEAAPESRRRLTPIAEQLLKTAQERLDAKQEERAQRQRARQREEAEALAMHVGREKLKQRLAQEQQAERQLQHARERQLKSLYQRALAAYRQGFYDEAIQMLQQMVVVDPEHPLVKAADRMIARAELKGFEQRLRSSASLSSESRGAIIPELQGRLAQKRMELETVLKYARQEFEGRNYDMAEKMLTAVLVQDPSAREARRLLEQVQRAALVDERGALTKTVERDEERMLNEVMKAQVLPETAAPAAARPPLVTQGAHGAMAAALRQPVSFEFKDVALSDVIEFIADAANVSIIPSPNLDLKAQRVSLAAKDLPLEQAIKYLTKSLSLKYRLEPDVILLGSAEEFSNEPLQTRVFFLHNGLGPFALTTSALEPNPALAMETIKDLIERAIPQVPDSKFVVDERSGAIVVTNTTEHLAMLERLLGQLDVTPTQVFIEARFIELTMTELEQRGIEAILNGDVALTKKGDPKGGRGAGHQLSSSSGFKFPELKRESEGLNLTLQGVLTGTQFETILHLLEESKKSKTLSAPRVTTLNNQTATIRVVEEFNYPTRYEVSLIQFDINGDGDFDDAGETEFANVPQDLQKRDIGILLNVTPSVGKNLNTITLVLAPEVSQFSEFRNLGGGVTIPQFTSSQLTTSIVIEEGHTVVLGGLMKDSTATQLTKIPVLGDVPLVGELFRQNRESRERKNLLIFITARVLAPRGSTT